MKKLAEICKELENKPKDIVVTIPKNKIEEVEQEEADVAKREAAGEKNISYYWQMGVMPKQEPKKIYFAWDNAVRAYHEVICVDRESKRIYMKTKINELEKPIPISSFRGFRYI